MESIPIQQQINFPTLQQTLEMYSINQNQQWKNQKIDLVDYTIIDKNDQDILYVQQAIQQLKFSCQKESKSIACFVGSAIADAMGAFTEGNEYSKIRNNIINFESFNDLPKKRCLYGQYTDDTSMALCIADSLLLNNLKLDALDLRHRFILWWFHGYNNGLQNNNEQNQKISFGIGERTYQSFNEFFKTPQEYVIPENQFLKQNSGNGSIMRLAPIPIAFSNNIDKGLEYAEKQSYCTHTGEEAADCCRLLFFVAQQLINSNTIDQQNLKQILENIDYKFQALTPSVQCIAESKKEENFQKYIGSKYDQSLEDRNWNWRSPDFDYSPFRLKHGKNLIGIYACDCLAMSLHILYFTNSYNEAILKAVNLGGDDDTVGAVTGLLAGAYYGFQQDMKILYKYVMQWDDTMIATKAYKLYKLNLLTNKEVLICDKDD